MPSPLIHFATGAMIAHRAGRDTAPLRWRLVAVALFMSILPDLDFLAGLAAGNPTAYHNQFTHSLCFGLAVCLTVAIPLRRLLLPSWSLRPVLALLVTCYGAHLLLDLVTTGSRGLKLFWPFSDVRYAAPFSIFYGVKHSEGLFAHEHLITIASELAFVATVFLACKLYCWKRKDPAA